MKYTKLLIICAVALIMVTGCRGRNNQNQNSPSAVNPGSVASGILPGNSADNALDNELSNWEDFASDYRPDSSGYPDLSDDMYDSENDFLDISDLDDQSAAQAMSTDFSEIGALDSAMLEWGSGGPVDDQNRPGGSLMYQEKYGKYNALFLKPGDDKVYITFDEGYENGYTPSILKTLKEKGVKAAFFITYDFASQHPELVQQMIDDGHALGNHSTKHKPYPTLELAAAQQDLFAMHDYVKQNFGYRMTMFRFPEGKFSEQTLALLQSRGYKSVFWSFAYVDWLLDEQPLTIEAMEKVVSKVHPGAIYLLHAVSKTNAEILGEAIDAIRAKGFVIGDANALK